MVYRLFLLFFNSASEFFIGEQAIGSFYLTIKIRYYNKPFAFRNGSVPKRATQPFHLFFFLDRFSG